MLPATQRAPPARSRKQPCFFRRLTSGMPSLTYRESSAVSDWHTAPPGGGTCARAFPAPLDPPVAARSGPAGLGRGRRGRRRGSRRGAARGGGAESRSAEPRAAGAPLSPPPGCRALRRVRAALPLAPSPSEWIANWVLAPRDPRAAPPLPLPRRHLFGAAWSPGFRNTNLFSKD